MGILFWWNQTFAEVNSVKEEHDEASMCSWSLYY